MVARVTELSNGLRVASDPMDSVGTATVGCWVGAGARAEPASINGVAHFLEHMAFKGTKRRSALAIAEEIEAVGGYLNAYTARENTAYYAKVLAEDLPLGFDIVSDILLNPTFAEEELARERSVILQEIGQCFDTPDDLVFDVFQEAAFPEQAMGRPVLGSVETVTEMPRDAIRDFMAKRYAGETMVLTAAGKVDHDRLVALAEEAFTELPARADAEVHAPAAYQGGEARIERQSEQVHILLGFPGASYADGHHYASGVLSALFGGGMSSRLFQEIREKRGLVYSVYSFGWAFTDTGLFGIYAGTGPEDVAELVPVICGEVEKLLSKGISDQELTRAKAQIKASLLMSRESTGGRADQLGQQMLIHGRPLTEAEQIEKLEAVDATTVLDTARMIFEGPPTLAAIGPLGKLESIESIQGRLPKAA